jgi:hypothetical protein
MRIDLNNLQREPLGRVEIDLTHPQSQAHPPNVSEHGIPLDWDNALDSQGVLQHCPACGCRELFARKDFPQRVGLAIVVLGAAAAVVMFAIGYVIWGFAVMGSVALADLLISPFVKRCVVCYRCRSEFRNLKIPRNHPAWDLATGEKYRPTPDPNSDTPNTAPHHSHGH